MPEPSEREAAAPTHLAWCVPLLLAATLVALGSAGAAHAGTLADAVFFTKRVEQLTGGSGRGSVSGQDSAITLRNGSGAIFLFGDTWADCQMIPNSMASTAELDVSDGASLVYYEDESGRALPPLPKHPATGETTVWLEAVFRRDADVCAFYYMVPPAWPDHSPEEELGGGIACMAGGSPPFVRLGTNVLPGHPHLLGPMSALQLGPKSLAFFVNETVDGAARTFLARTSTATAHDFSTYTYWDGRAWSANPEDRAPVLSNFTAPSVAWNDHLGAWVAMGSLVGSPDGFLSRFGLATSRWYTGPWSETIPLYGETGGGEWGSVYNAFRTAAFDQEGGRRMFTTATHSGRYNVDLFETDVGHAESHFCLASGADDADQLAGGAASTSGPSLLLAPGSRSVIGLRLTGASWVQGAAGVEDPLDTPAVAATSLVLPLAAEAAQSFSARLRVRAGAPNAPAWGSAADLFVMPAVFEIVVDVPVAAGARELRIGNEVAALFGAVSQESGWMPGYDNVVPITLSRLDDHPLDLQLASREESRGGEAWLCHGTCPPAPPSLGECRPPAEFVAHDCSAQEAKTCGLGGEIVLLLPVLGLLRRRRREASGTRNGRQPME